MSIYLFIVSIIFISNLPNPFLKHFILHNIQKGVPGRLVSFNSATRFWSDAVAAQSDSNPTTLILVRPGYLISHICEAFLYPPHEKGTSNLE